MGDSDETSSQFTFDLVVSLLTFDLVVSSSSSSTHHCSEPAQRSSPTLASYSK